MAQENPELKAFGDYHKHTKSFYEVHDGIDKVISSAQKGIHAELGKFFNDKSEDKGFISFKDEKAARKGAEEIYNAFAKAVYSNYLATTKKDEAKALLKDDRLFAQLEHLLELRTQISREGFIDQIAKQKYFRIEDLIHYEPRILAGTKGMELSYLERQAKPLFWEDTKTFNKYVKQLLKDHASDADVQKALKEVEEKGEIETDSYTDENRKNFHDPRNDQKVWRVIAGQLSDSYNFKKKLEELAEKAA
jgi:hypothetical protein